MATEDDVRALCLALPGVTERPSGKQPAWFGKTIFARIWEPGVVTLKSEEREALARTDPETFFWTPHHDRPPANLVLIRLARIGRDELAEMIGESYRIAGGPGKPV
ncbi:MmcQ/YjbR family DNA-binding protein [Sinomonas sp. JGH33]|uniref:MmcQ/YjbR family DNA-binding protein n=1 Tax=Sinomonas terricola TaxID=3110330 RepID=A0ABU5T2K2_9MICC|nr:MmcQ/YjbR family DNA-binding protein [Sinomonas sp. JGH33]MEA5453903.1 MmcQ/YjbR family DNA-binding protein [Sinomonas sp. JGH33]